MSTKNLDLQSLRALACLIVVVFHVACLEPNLRPGYDLFERIRHFGFCGVDYFFVLSGFIITFTSFDKLGQRAEIPSFLGRRFWRIFPTYWFCLSLALLACYLVLGYYFWRDKAFLRVFPLEFFLFPRPALPTILNQAWTLTFEVMFYTAFSVFFLTPKRWFPWLLLAWGMIVGAFALAGDKPPHYALLALRPIVWELLAGCLIAWSIKNWNGKGANVVLGLGMVSAILGVRHWMAVGIDDERLRVLCYGVPAALIIYGLAGRGLSKRPLLPAFLRPLGDASYSIYLVHMLPMVLASQCGWFPQNLNRSGHFLALTILSVVCVALGYGIYWGVERRILNLGRSLFRRSAIGPAPHFGSRRDKYAAPVGAGQ